MKKYLLALVILSGIIITGCTAGYVTSRPQDVVYARPASPGPAWVWTSGEWQYSGGKYHWHEGSWQRARENHTWKSGYWEKSSRGYRWHNGNWQK